MYAELLDFMGAERRLVVAAREEVLVVALDRARSERVRRMWPFLRDRRIDHYRDLALRYRDRM